MIEALRDWMMEDQALVEVSHVWKVKPKPEGGPHTWSKKKKKMRIEEKIKINKKQE